MSEVSVPIRMRLCIEDILRGRIPLFDGVEKLLGLSEQVPALAHDRDVRRLQELLGQVEHLPVGAQRELWNAEALHKADRELMELERQQKETVFYGCRRLLTTLDSVPG